MSMALHHQPGDSHRAPGIEADPAARWNRIPEFLPHCDIRHCPIREHVFDYGDMGVRR
jgi:hypothetical protein